MQEAGDILRQAREAKGLSIEELHQRTRIRPKLIESMEQGEFSAVPGGMVYVRGFVRTLAIELEIDADEVLGLLGGAPLTRTPPVSAAHRPKRGSNRPLILGIVLLIAILAAVGIYLRFFHSTDPIAELPPDNNTPVTHDPLPPDEPEEPAPQPPVEPLLPEPEPFILISDQNDVSQYEVAQWPLTLVVKVLRNRCWISGTADGAPIQGTTVSAGEERTINADGSLRLRLGLAEVTEITVNGHSLGPQTGYVRDYVFTPVSP